MSTPVLYDSTAKTFFNLGEGPLNDTLSCTVKEERNGLFILEMVHPVDSPAFSLLHKDKLIKVDAGHKLKAQRFRIKKIQNQLTEKLGCMQNIFLIAQNIWH